MRYRTIQILAVALVCLLAMPGFGSSPKPGKPVFLPANVPFTDEDPSMDGAATDTDEWEKALVIPDSFFFGAAWRAGFYYFQSRMDWTAKSVGSGAEAMYSGQTSFVAHDIIGSGDPKNFLYQFREDDDYDWNSFEFPVKGGKAKIWVFDDVDDPDDGDWIMSSEGIQLSPLIPEGTIPNRIDDRGFIARLNDDPETDVHWLPGMPEPGDAAWDWEDWHYVFGRHTFGQSFQDVGTDPDAENAVDHEVYEFCSYNPDWSPGKDPPWCLWWGLTPKLGWQIKWKMVVIDGVRRGWTPVIEPVIIMVPILRGQFWLHFWPPPPEMPVGTPPADMHAFRIIMALENLFEGASPAASRYLELAIGAFDSAFFEGLLQGDRKLMFKYLKKAYKYLGKAKKRGIAAEDTIDTEMQALSLVGQTALDLEIKLDRAGATIENKSLLKASKGIYGFGKALAKVGRKGIKGKPFKAIIKLKKVFKTLDKLEETQLREE